MAIPGPWRGGRGRIEVPGVVALPGIGSDGGGAVPIIHIGERVPGGHVRRESLR